MKNTTTVCALYRIVSKGIGEGSQSHRPPPVILQFVNGFYCQQDTVNRGASRFPYDNFVKSVESLTEAQPLFSRRFKVSMVKYRAGTPFCDALMAFVVETV